MSWGSGRFEVNSMQMDTDTMTYEQLMDLEDSMGVVSRGLREEHRKMLLARC